MTRLLWGRSEVRMRKLVQSILLLTALTFSALTGYNLYGLVFINPPEKMTDIEFEIREFLPPALGSLPDTLYLNPFETENDLKNMILLYGPLHSEGVEFEGALNARAARLSYDSARYVEVAFNYTPPWWNQYDSLILNVFRPAGKLIEISLRAGDFYTSDGYCASCQKFYDLVLARPGETRFSYAIDSIGSLIDISTHFKSLHIGFNPREANELYLYNFMLVKDDE